MSEPAASRRLAISWIRLHSDCLALVEKLRPHGPFSALITVTRGGLVPASIVARELSLRVVETISIASYERELRGELRYLKEIAPRFLQDRGAGVLIVDDLSDTGQTASALRQLLPGALLATVYAKPLGVPHIDLFVEAVPQDTWIDFPWDLAPDNG